MELIEERRTKKNLVNESRTRLQKLKAQEEYNHIAKKVKGSLKKDKESYIDELAENAEKAASNGEMRTLYQITKTLSGKFSLPEVPVKDKEGKMIFGKEAHRN